MTNSGPLSPLLANVALSVLDEHFARLWTDRVERNRRRRHGLANYRLVRYADDWLVMVWGTRALILVEADPFDDRLLDTEQPGP